jgi:FemAB-related protein (PEP-CTERM system-associated)
MIVEKLTPEAHGAWDAYVDGHPDATCYHLRAWQSVAEDAYRLRAPFLLARESHGGPVRGVLPLFVLRNPLGGYVTTGLFGAYGRVLAEDTAAGEALVSAAQEITRAARARYLVLKTLGEEPLAAGFTRRDTCVVARLPLAHDPQLLWKGFRDKIRNSVRKAQKNGLELRAGHEQLPPYYDILAENMHRKGTPIYGFTFMQRLAQALGDRAEVLTLWWRGRAVSAALVVYYRGVVYVPFASSRRSAFHLAPNNLLYWEIMKRGCEREMSLLDFGRSPREASTLQFKLGWGAQTVPLPFYVYAPKGAAPSFDANESHLRVLAQLWQKLPRPLADTLGPAVCRRFLA